MTQPKRFNCWSLARFMRGVQVGFEAFFVAPLIVLCALAAPASAGAAGEQALKLEVQGDSGGAEARVKSFAAFLPDRRVRVDMEGYSPSAAGIPMPWQGPAELVWDFGDGSPKVSTGERASASHFYDDQGSYTVVVTARDSGGVYATGTRVVTVTNSKPSHDDVAAVEIDPDTSTVELTATAQDVPGDPLLYSWDFGDGQSDEGEELWRVRHRYEVPGDYEVVLTLTDGDEGEETEKQKVRVVGAPTALGSEREELGEEPPTEVVTTALEAKMRGVYSVDLEGEVRSFRGLYLRQIASGACRFVFSAWDDAHLAYLFAVVDLFGVPPEGARYTIHEPVITLIFEPKAEYYDYFKKGAFGGVGSGGLGGLVEEMASVLPEAERRAIGEQAGIEAKARDAGERVAMPATSPLGIDERVTFKTRSGRLELTFIPGDRAVGRFDLSLESVDGPTKGQGASFDGTLALDLVAARRDGIVNYDGCEPALFDVEDTWPKADTKNLIQDRPKVWARFTDAVDPETVDEESFQVAYPGSNGEMVPVAGRILREEQKALFVPDQPLLPGVRHTARVRTGDDGVRGRSGAPLEDHDGSGWRSWKFTTRIDLIPETDGSQLLSCHLFQTVRDAPLLPGKAAVARVYAAWQKQSGVAESAQVEELTARVVVQDGDFNELASLWHTFVRPDLWARRGIDLRAAEHTAQITGFEVKKGMVEPLRIALEVRVEPGSDELWPLYRAHCPTKIWDRSPKLSLDFVALPFGEWADPAALAAVRPALERIASEAAIFAWQVFPVAEVNGSAVRVLEFPAGYRLPPIAECPPGCLMSGAGPDSFWAGFDGWLRGQSSADIVVAFGPHGIQAGGSTGGRLRQGRGTVLMLVGDNQQNFSRYVEETVHEIGHALGLDHLPPIPNGPEAEATREAVTALREGSTPLVYRGIEGLRMSRDGQTAWNKSSVEGNEEDGWLAPLMFPATFPTSRAFIANHHYRAMQRLFEELGR